MWAGRDWPPTGAGSGSGPGASDTSSGAGAALEVVAEKNERWLEIVLPCGHQAFVQRGDGDLREAPWTWPRRSVEDTVALAKLLPQVAAWPGPVYFRMCRNEVPLLFDDSYAPRIGQALTLRPGGDVTLIGTGLMVSRCLEAAQIGCRHMVRISAERSKKAGCLALLAL
mgnify:CR=1 FL=1